MSILTPGMKGDLVCQSCKCYGLQVIYTREAQGQQKSYGEGRRKQAWIRFGVWCTRCGCVFYDEATMKRYLDEVKEAKKGGWYSRPKWRLKIKLFKKFTKSWQTDKLVPVKDSD